MTDDKNVISFEDRKISKDVKEILVSIPDIDSFFEYQKRRARFTKTIGEEIINVKILLDETCGERDRGFDFFPFMKEQLKNRDDYKTIEKVANEMRNKYRIYDETEEVTEEYTGEEILLLAERTSYDAEDEITFTSVKQALDYIADFGYTLEK